MATTLLNRMRQSLGTYLKLMRWASGLQESRRGSKWSTGTRCAMLGPSVACSCASCLQSSIVTFHCSTSLSPVGQSSSSPKHIVGEHCGPELGRNLWKGSQNRAKPLRKPAWHSPRRLPQAASPLPKLPALQYARPCSVQPVVCPRSVHPAVCRNRPTVCRMRSGRPSSVLRKAKNTRVMPGPHTSWSSAVLMSTALLDVGSSAGWLGVTQAGCTQRRGIFQKLLPPRRFLFFWTRQ